MSITNMLKKVANAALKVVNDFIPKDANSVFLFPNEGGAVDGYNITNYNSDNVLCLANSLLKDEKYNDYNLYIVYFKDDELQKCQEYVEHYHPERVHFVKFKLDFNFFKAYSKCAKIFIANDYRVASYKSRKQCVVCLNYWIVPLKKSIYGMTDISLKQYISLAERKNTSIDFFITTSDFCSFIVNCFHSVLLSKILPLGFPRNDLFYGGEVNVTKDDFCNYLGFVPDHIICYTPTHRDSENPHRKLFDSRQSKNRTLFGNLQVEEDAPMNEFLENTNSVIIVKAHYAQEMSIISYYKSKRIIYFSEINRVLNINLHEIFLMSDLFITDYSSSFYDGLCLDKPVVYYMYDYNEYNKTRGFLMNPIEPILAGPVVIHFDDLIKELNNILEGRDDYKNQRIFIRNLVDKNQDGNSSKRIKDFFLSKSN